jgi:hypothetical protein
VNRLRALPCALLLLLGATGAPQDRPAPAFVAVDVFVDVGARRLAAWQVEITLATGQLVGVEGGSDTAFADAPRYDPAALQGGRVILAALAQDEALPTGRVRVARIHVMDEGPAPGACRVRGVVAADAAGDRIETADVEVRRIGDGR